MHSPPLSFKGVYSFLPWLRLRGALPELATSAFMGSSPGAPQEIPSPTKWVERGKTEGWGLEGEAWGDGEGEKAISSFQSFLNIPTSEKTETQGGYII